MVICVWFFSGKKMSADLKEPSDVVNTDNHVVDDDGNDDVPTLSADTFSALQQFYVEQDARDKERKEIQVSFLNDYYPI
jgi:hypothetical protein